MEQNDEFLKLNLKELQNEFKKLKSTLKSKNEEIESLNKEINVLKFTSTNHDLDGTNTLLSLGIESQKLAKKTT